MYFIDVYKYNKFRNKRKLVEANSSNGNSGSKKNKACLYFKKKKGPFKEECRYWKKMKKKHLSGSSNKVNVVEEHIKELDVMVLDLHISMITKVHMATFSDTNG